MIERGDWVRVRHFRVRPVGQGSIAGAQPKVLADLEEFNGRVAHIWGDRPVDPDVVTLGLVKPDGSVVEANLNHVIATWKEEA